MEVTSNSFYNFIADGKLMATKCSICKSIFLPPRPICTTCHSNEMNWFQLSGKGKLIAYSVISVGLSFMSKEGFDRKNPYCSGIVKLEEGPGISAWILGVNTKEIENIKIGMPGRIEFLERGENRILVFRVE